MIKKIVDATLRDIKTIETIARNTWGETYGNIISQEQIEYMLDMMYNESSIINQIENLNHHFLLIKDDTSNDFLGFVSYEPNYKNENKTKIHKLYVLPNCQGAGLGKELINETIERARINNNMSILLNMNRSNKSLGFYEQMGFNIVGEEDINIGNGYLMEDYIFEKKI